MGKTIETESMKIGTTVGVTRRGTERQGSVLSESGCSSFSDIKNYSKAEDVLGI